MAMSRTMLLLTSASLFACGGAIAAPPSPGGGAGGPSNSAPRYNPAEEFRKGAEALQAEKYKDALKAFQRVLAVAPNDARSNYLAGRSAVGLNDYKTARKYYERALKADKQMVHAYLDLGVTYLKLGDRAKAEEQLGKLKAMQTQCASTCDKSNEIGGAVDALASALGSPTQAGIEARPGLIFTSTQAGDRAYVEAVGLINEGRYEEAIVSLEASRDAFGPHPDILTYLGFANRKLLRYDTAEGYYRAALAVTPDHRAATEYYGELMVERGDTRGAKLMLARLDANCSFGCAEADELRRWIEDGPRAR